MSKDIIEKQNLDEVIKTVLAVADSDDIDARIYCANAAKPLAEEVVRLRKLITGPFTDANGNKFWRDPFTLMAHYEKPPDSPSEN